MTTIALHRYSQKIEQLIEDNQFDEAITHCRHILQQHPRYVNTYRTLAKVYLERGNYTEAVDLIQRILSTNPSDLIAHAALSIAYKEQSQLDQSIWHLERALDVDPYNAPLREELLDLYTLKKSDVPDSMAPSSAALARIYLQSEMYHAAIMELRQSLAQEPERIDLKVLLAETLYWANQRVEAVSLSLEILDVLPNCIPVNAILADIWLQTGRVAEAQTYLNRLRAMTLPDRVHFDPETIVGRAFIARGAPPIPDEIIVEQFGEEPLLEPESDTAVITMVDSDWIEEFSMEDTAELSEEEMDEGVTGWLNEAALAGGKNFGTQPLVMPSDPLEADTDWFIDPGDEDDESLDELLGDVGGDAQLDDWLTELDSEVSAPAGDEPDEPDDKEKTGFTGMLTGLLDSELEMVDDTAVPSGFTDLFEEPFEPQTEDAVDDTAVTPPDFTDLFEDIPDAPVEDDSVLDLAELAELDMDQFLADEDDESWPEDETAGMVDDDSFAEGLTALFVEMDSTHSEAADSDSLEETEEINLAEFLGSDLGALADMEKPDEEEEHTGYTQLFDQLSTDAFPEEPETLDSDWLTPTTDALAPDLADEGVPDWMAEVKQDEFEPVQIDPKLTSDWLTESDGPAGSADDTAQSDWLTSFSEDEPEADAADEDDWLAELAGDTPEAAVPDSQLPDSDDLSDIPTWMLGGEQDPSVFETPAPIDFAESAGFETDELEESTAVPTWLLGGDKPSEETGALDESAPLDDFVPPESTQSRENPQTILAGEELPDWLRQPESDKPEEPETADPLQTDSMMSLADEDLPDWLTGELPDLDGTEEIPEAGTADPLATDSMSDLASGDLPDWLRDDEPDVTARPIPEPDSELDLYKDDINIPDWLMADFSTGQDQAEVSVTGDKDERESIPPQEQEEISESSFDSGDDDDLGWLADLAAADEEPQDEAESASYASRVAAGEGGAVDEPPTQVSMPDELPDFAAESDALDWTGAFEESEAEMDDVLAGVTGELNADLDWLDSLSEEAADAVEPDDDLIDEFDSGTGWLDALAVAGDAGPLDELGSEPILPDFQDSLAVLPEEPEDGLDWLSELEMTGDSVEFAETAVPAEPETEDAATDEPPEDIDDAMAWLEGLAAGQGALLEELPSMADELATEPRTKPEAEVAQDMPDESLDWLDAAVDEAEEDDFAIESGLETDISAITEPEITEPEIAEPESEVEDTAPEDIEDAMAWLEGLAAKQGARREELPSMADEDLPVPDAADEAVPESPDTSMEWLEEFAEDAVEDIDAPFGLGLEDGDLESVDASLDWLEAMPETEAEAEAEELPEQALEEAVEADLAVDVPDSMDDALVWLDALAEEQDGPDEELPVVTDETAVSDFDEFADDTPADLDDAMGWLEDLAAEQVTPLEDMPTIAGVVDEEMFVEPSDEAAPQPEPETPADELTEALDWLEQLALKDSKPLMAMPVRETAVPDSGDDLAEALDWLEQSAQPEEAPEKSVDGIIDLADLTDEMPEDPDEALAWLQQVAAEQEDIEDMEPAAKDEDQSDVELFELPETTDITEPETESGTEPAAALEESTTAETEADILAEMPDDPDAAMAWLEQLAARQGARLDELPTVSADEMPVVADEMPVVADEMPVVADEMLVVADEPAPELESPVDLADTFDPEQPALEDDAAWLDELMDLDEEAVAAVHDAVEFEEDDFPEADLTELDVPEDLDDAMAWLEALAAQQGAKLEELPTLTGTGELPPESLGELDEAVETAVVPAAEEITAEDEEAAAPAEVPEMDEASFIPDEEMTEDETYLSEGFEEALPDWLDADTDSLAEMTGQTQWLRELDEPDIEGWLGEEETTISSGRDRVVQSRFDPTPDDVFETGPLSLSADTAFEADLFDMPEEEIETTIFSLDDEKLASARQAVENDRFDEALQAYQTLIEDGGGMMTLIADLETVAVDHPEQPLFCHLLGDAYMRNGQLQKALDTYRIALDQI